MLGFYVMQSLTSSLWRPVFNTLLANILVSQNSPAATCIITGTVISIVFALALLIIDAARSHIVRKPKRCRQTPKPLHPWQVPAFYSKLAVKVRRAFTIGQSQGRIR